MSIFKKISISLKKTSGSITKQVENIFSNKRIDEETLEQLEEMLITADIGVESVGQIISKFAKNKFAANVTIEDIQNALALEIASILKPYAKQMSFEDSPQVVLVCGVNGNGKTTSIGKLAHKLTKGGKKVLVVGCDTFRAAALEQLEVWSKRSQASFMEAKEGADPASIAYKAVQRAIEEHYDVVLIDTAGRLQSNANLMEELAKIERSIKKVLPHAPHDTLLVLDATTGQNALVQMESFSKIVKISGIIVNKLDGSAKAGVLIAVVSKFKMPVYYIGVGEQIEDLLEFNPEEFAKGLLGIE